MSKPAYTYLHDQNIIDSIQRDTRNGLYDLDDFECWWRDRYSFLLRRGYSLRPRFRPGWMPSWLGTNASPFYCEDSFKNVHPKTIDATRVSDGTVVFLKQVPNDSNETAIGRFLSSSKLVGIPENHCVPILDSFSDESDKNISFIVMPLLRRYNDPPFFSTNEVVECMRQCLEGLVFIHDRGVAHRDLSYLNIMMDAKSLYPEGYHPSARNLAPSVLGEAKCLKRSEVSGVKYFFTDFGISTHFKEEDSPRLVVGNVAQDREVPELSLHVPYDPFAVDVFTLGNLFKRQLVERYKNLQFLIPLTTAMTNINPKRRPTAATAFANFKELVAKQQTSFLNWRLQSIDETAPQKLWLDITYFVGQLKKNRLFLASLISIAAGSAAWLLYGPQTILRRLRSLREKLFMR